MNTWYYERNGKAQGPVGESALIRLYGRGVVNDDTPVWPSDTPEKRTVLGATEIDLPPLSAVKLAEPVASPPIASDEPKKQVRLPSKPKVSIDDDFFTSPLVRSYIGKNTDKYLSKWRKMHLKSDGDWNKTISRPSFHWPAFFLCFAWPFYRKSYYLGFGVLSVLALSSVASDSIARAIGTGLSVGVAMMANAIYLRQVRNYWAAHRNAPDFLAAAKAGGTNLWGGIGGIVALLFMGALFSVSPNKFKALLESNFFKTERVNNSAVDSINEPEYQKAESPISPCTDNEEVAREVVAETLGIHKALYMEESDFVSYLSLDDISSDKKVGNIDYCSGTLNVDTERLGKALQNKLESIKSDKNKTKEQNEETAKMFQLVSVTFIMPFQMNGSGVRIRYNVKKLDDGRDYTTVTSKQLLP